MPAFRTPAGWARATRVVAVRPLREGRAFHLATDDADGRRLVVSLRRRGEGVIALAASVAGGDTSDILAVALGFTLRRDERQLGFGERSNAVDQRGRVVEDIVTEGPYQRDELPVLGAFVPPWALSDRADATTFPLPWLLSTAGYGVLVENDEPSRFRLGTEDPGTWRAEADAATLRLLVVAGPRPADALRRLTAADAEYRRSGLPIMRHLALAHPGDPAAAATDDAFLFGPDILAAPVVVPGARSRSLHLPPGRWIDLWRSATYEPADGSLRLGGARVLVGAASAELPAPLDELPLLVRAGALLPLLPPDVDTLSSYGDSAGAVSLRERAGQRRLFAFPRGRSHARIGAGDGVVRSREGRRRWDLDVATRRVVRWQVQASLASLERPLRPCRLELDGRRLPAGAWSYDAADAVLRATLRTRRGRLSVHGCRR